MFFPRRDFLKRAALSAGAVAAYGPVEMIAADTRPVSKSANETLNVAMVGCGGRGGEHVQQWASSGEKNTHITYLCDVDTSNSANKLKTIAQKQGIEPKMVQDFRRALDDKDVDIVSIATPNHWHSLVAILAIQAGKHVYVEKPVSHNVWEGRQLANWAAKSKVLVQTGTQSRSSAAIDEAEKFLNSGGLGKIKYAVGLCYKARFSIGKLDKPLAIPPEIDYDLWCGPAAKVDLYRPKFHYDWHWDWNTGNGDMGNQGIHQMDIARRLLGEPALSPAILSLGGRLGYSDAGNTPNTQTVLHAYEKAPLIFETRGLPKDKASQGNGKWGGEGVMDEYEGYKDADIAVVIHCEQGALVVPAKYSVCTAYDNDKKVIQTWTTSGEKRKDDVVTLHFTNLAEAVRANDPKHLKGPIVDGHLSSALCHTGGISHQLGRPATVKEIEQAVGGNKVFADSFSRMADHLRRNGVQIDNTPAITLGAQLQMDPKTERFEGNEQANTLLTREYRKPYVVPQA